MTEQFDWDKRLETLLTGALAVWRLEGSVTREGPACCTVQSTDTALTVQRITDDGDPYWEVTPTDGVLPPLPFGGIQGMLRAVREMLGADPTGARLVIGPGGEA